MHTIFLTTLLSLTAAADPVPGSLLFLQDSNRIVQRVTGSEISHVAIVMSHKGKSWVYEAEPAVVRRVPLTTYYQELADLNRSRKTKMKAWLLRPERTYRSSELADMKKFLDSQLGRRYSVRNYVRGKPGEGIHCAELAAEALSFATRYDLKRAYAFDPGALLKHLQPEHRQPRIVSLPRATPKKSWCERSWKSWLSCREWCEWSCYETWAFCR